jgi:ribulose-5-phosphate 4-epimerase/fuculose-1-phosphate aldolase
VETGLHFGVYRIRPDVNAVLHFQSPCATAIACGDPARYDFHVIPEIAYYIQKLAIVDYYVPGSPELAAAVVPALQNHNLVILRNHGLVTVGRSLPEAIQNAGFFELACEILLRGRDLRPLSRTANDQLIAHANRRAGA